MALFRSTFSHDIYEQRLSRICEGLEREVFNALVVQQFEYTTHLTGFYTSGYSTSQLVVIPADSETLVIARDVEEHYIDTPCIVPNSIFWKNSDGPVSVGR